MARGSSPYRDVCPFWSEPAMKCQLCRDGLFIPLNDHIAAYCRTRHHSQCLHYSLYSANGLRPAETGRRDRRKYPRVASCHAVTLVELVKRGQFDPQGAAADGEVIRGTTLDLGKGGMRLTTGRPPVRAARIRFSFEDSFPLSVRTGHGQIAWWNRPHNQYACQLGIAFQDPRLIDIMGLYLGLITSSPPVPGLS